MNLEELKGEFRIVAEMMEYNNTTHYELNEELLNSNPVEMGIAQCKGEVYPEGIINDLIQVMLRLKRLTENQSNNVRRTSELVKYDNKVQVETKLPQEYLTKSSHIA